MFNQHATVGEDPEFGRGVSAFNRGSGDPDHDPNPSLAPSKGPLLRDQGAARQFRNVCRTENRPDVPRAQRRWRAHAGLYAAGSDQANVMGGHYPSGGINIGPAMTFGYIAGRHAAGVGEYENVTPMPMNDGN